MYFPMVVEPFEGVVGAAGGPEGAHEDHRQMPSEPTKCTHLGYQGNKMAAL